LLQAIYCFAFPLNIIYDEAAFLEVRLLVQRAFPLARKTTPESAPDSIEEEKNYQARDPGFLACVNPLPSTVTSA
jgi:hypothetical protein